MYLALVTTLSGFFFTNESIKADSNIELAILVSQYKLDKTVRDMKT